MSFLTADTRCSLDSLPIELLENILWYFQPKLQKHLAPCVLVNRAWNEVLTPFLWQTLDFRYAYERRERLLSSEAQQVLAKNAMFVQGLGLDHHSLYLRLLSPRVTQPWQDAINIASTPDEMPTTASSPSSSLFTNLNSLKLFPPKGHPIPDLEQRIMTLVLHNPGIKTFHMKLGIDPKVLLSLVTEYMPHLQHLKLSVVWHGNVKTLLYNLPSCIRTINISNAIYEPPISQDPETFSVADRDRTTTLVRPHWDLESLIIDGEFAQQEVDVVVPFLESCSRKLKVVDGLRHQFLTNPAIADALTKIGYVWKELSLRFSLIRLTDAELASIVCSSAQWTNITLPILSAGPLTAAAITDHCRHLETLDLVRGPVHVNRLTEFTGHHLQAILSKASNLRAVQVGWNIQDRMITTTDILSSEWATTSLEHLEFKIRFERPPNVATINSIQRQVLQRLGRQTRLRKFLLGGRIPIRLGGGTQSQYSCLDLSLESGLDELVSLKNLEILDVHHMHHKIAVRELEWIVQHLPELQVQGVASKTVRIEVLRWLSQHRPTWRRT